MITLDKLNILAGLKLAGANIHEDQIEIVDWGCPHKTKILPNGKMAVYLFFLGNDCLKIGKVGPNSNARYNSQHYNPKDSKSNLANSILSDNSFPEKINDNEIGNWIKNNIQRINVLIDENVGIFALNFIEAYLQLVFKPKYEGFKTQNN